MLKQVRIAGKSSLVAVGFGFIFFAANGYGQYELPAKKTAESNSVSAPVPEITTNQFPAYNGQPAYQFNSQSDSKNSSTRDSFQFKVPTDEKSLSDDRTARPMDNYKNDAPFKTYIGYPKQRFTLGFAPVTYSGKFTYTGSGTGNGTDFNFSSSSYTGLNLGYQLMPTPTIAFEAESNYLSASTADGTPTPFTVNKSTANVYNLFIRGNYCFVGDNFFSRLCPGLELGLDSYPLLGFIDNSTMEMQKATEITYGANLLFTGPLVKSVVGKARLGYLLGSGLGQSGLTSKKNTAYYLAPQIEWPMLGGFTNIGFNYLLRSSSVEGAKGGTTEKWGTTMSALTILVGFSWELAD